MKSMERFEPIWLMLVLIGGLNWAMIGLFETNVLADVFGTGTFTDVVYTVVGFAALMLVPRLMDAMHIHMPGHDPAHGAR